MRLDQLEWTAYTTANQWEMARIGRGVVYHSKQNGLYRIFESWRSDGGTDRRWLDVDAWEAQCIIYYLTQRGNNADTDTLQEGFHGTDSDMAG